MPDSDIVLRFVYDTKANSDIRNFRVFQVIANAPELLQVYRFHHPAAGYTIPTTSFQRKNLAALLWETAGHIEWSPRATVWFGVDQVSVKELRKVKHGTSQSRRFKVSGNEYKWKIEENGKDLTCIDTKGQHAASWSAEENVLKIAQHCNLIIERILVTCFLNLWFKQQGRW